MNSEQAIEEIKNNDDLDKALLAAVENNQNDMVESLLEKGANVDSRNKDRHTGLMLASKRGYSKLVQTFLKEGADPDAKNSDWTPLTLAVQYDHEEIVRDLLEYNANIDLSNGRYNPLTIAANFNLEGIVKLLLAKGADINVTGSNHRTPITLARIKNYDKIVEILENEAMKQEQKIQQIKIFEIGVQETQSHHDTLSEILKEDFNKIILTISDALRSPKVSIDANNENNIFNKNHDVIKFWLRRNDISNTTNISYENVVTKGIYFTNLQYLKALKANLVTNKIYDLSDGIKVIKSILAQLGNFIKGNNAEELKNQISEYSYVLSLLYSNITLLSEQCGENLPNEENFKEMLGSIRVKIDDILREDIKALKLNTESKDPDYYNKAIEYLNEYEVFVPKILATCHAELGKIAEDAGDMDAAIGHYVKAAGPNKLIHIYKTLGELFYNLNHSNNATSHYYNTIGYLDKYKELSPGKDLNECNNIQANCYLELGKIAESENDINKSISYYIKSIEHDKKLPETYKVLGKLFYEKSEYKYAIIFYKVIKDSFHVDQCYKSWLNKDPKNPEIHIEFGDYKSSIGLYYKAKSSYLNASGLSFDPKLKQKVLEKISDLFSNNSSLEESYKDVSNFYNFDSLDQDFIKLVGDIARNVTTSNDLED